jgi:beta-N-acetylhexosaminidase
VLLIGKGDYPASCAAVVDAVKSGRVPRARLEASVARILEAKRKLGLFRDDAAARPLSEDQRRLDAALAQRAADEAVTVVRDAGFLPLKLAEAQLLRLVLFHSPRYSAEATSFASAVAARHANTELVDLPVSPSTSVAAGVLALPRAAVVIVGTYQYGTPVPAAQAGLVRALIAGPAPVAAVSLMNPYDLPVSAGARAAICAYGMTDSALEAVARVLFGEIKPKGRLPVAVPGE